MSDNPLHLLAAGADSGVLRPVPADLAAVPAEGIQATLGIRLTHVGLGRARAEMQLGPAHLNQRGLVQGGVLTVFADAAAGWASYAALPAARFTTLELGSRFVGRARPGALLVAEVRPVHQGRQVVALVVDIFDAEVENDDPRRLIGTFTCTQLVLGDPNSRS